ncbi:MAG: hypothetical protein ACREM8_11340, partial [Vulcanimicrobiaceae bacterium]
EYVGSMRIGNAPPREIVRAKSLPAAMHQIDQRRQSGELFAPVRGANAKRNSGRKRFRWRRKRTAPRSVSA